MTQPGSAPHPDPRPRVLVVDDEEANLETFERVFRKDFRVTVARSVDLAVQLAKKQEFDVALVDYAMPNANGVEFLRQAATLQPTMACVMLTAHADLDEVKQAHAVGLAKAIIIKPWDRDVILRWVGNAQRLAALKRSVKQMNSSLTKK
jgi:putative two-component system response regulator